MHTTDSLKPLSSNNGNKRSMDACSSPPAKRAKTTPTTPSSSRTSKARRAAEDAMEQRGDIKDKLTAVVTVTTRGPADPNGDTNVNINAKTVTLHIGMLAQKSPFLYRLALTSATPDLKLLELDSDAFGIFAAWVYSNTVTFDSDEGDAGDIFGSVLECYCLAQTLQAPEFANSVLAQACAVSAKHGLVFRNGVINEMYKRTSSGCALRRWIVDEWVWQYDSEAVGSGELDWEGNCDLCNGFLFEVVVAQARRIGRRAKKHQSPSKMVERYRQQ
ncbi:hypothetical protein LTR85_003817 [Meristemomyces frigidus]|nr:hypothetical protein LTR85_003817 [Meristemomyces frigidus]